MGVVGIMDDERIKITNFIQWKDRNGCYTDDRCDLEEVPRMSYEDAVKYFFIVMNDDFYYTKTDNIFALTLDEVSQYAKDNNFYEDTVEDLSRLLSVESPTLDTYRRLI
jgi:hypothetical protein